VKVSRPLVVSPHLDDAVLSCGQLLAAHPGAVVVTVFAGRPPSGAPLTRWDAASGFRDGDDVVGARRAEDRAALAALDARPVWLRFRDRQYGPPPAPDRVTAALGRVLAAVRPDAVVLPLGLYHSDHRLASEAALALRPAGGGGRWFVYADAIYRAHPGDPVGERLGHLAAAGLVTRLVGGAGRRHLGRKRQAAACYRSQIRALAAPGHPGWADALGPEQLWQLSP
jgi:LmbE family N-acetylglucosaminyl deacetylase